MNKDDFIKDINRARKNSNGGWYFWQGVVNDNKFISIKGYGTWLQVYKVNNIDCAGNMDVSVKKFNETLAEGLTQG